MHARSIVVPASTANLGPGFDSLALALNLHNTFVIEPAEQGKEISIRGEGSEELPRDETNLFMRSAERVFTYFRNWPPGFRIQADNQIPIRSGLGSSSSAVIGGIKAACVLLDEELDQNAILSLALELEVHADNVSAALLGGLVVVGTHEQEVVARKIPIPSISVVVVLPDIHRTTSSMRNLLPTRVSHADAVHNLSRTALTIEALRSADYDLLGWAMTDKLHQPYRSKLIPGYDAVQQAALNAGAAAVTLSGAGPSMVAFAPSNLHEIGAAMRAAFLTFQTESRSFVLGLDQIGTQVGDTA